MAHNKKKGYYYIGGNMFISSLSTDAPISDTDLRVKGMKNKREVTYTCTPPGNGVRIALDRDEDGFFDNDEKEAGSNPADPASVP